MSYAICWKIIINLLKNNKMLARESSSTTYPTSGTITVPNCDFETIYKPDSTVITADLSSPGWTQGVGHDCPIDVGQYNFPDETSGTLADITGWLGKTAGRPQRPPSFSRSSVPAIFSGRVDSQPTRIVRSDCGNLSLSPPPTIVIPANNCPPREQAVSHLHKNLL